MSISKIQPTWWRRTMIILTCAIVPGFIIWSCMVAMWEACGYVVNDIREAW